MNNENIIIYTLLNSQEAIMSCDLICGMQSMLLIESFIVNKPIMSIQIGINEDQDDFILAKLKLIKTVYNDNQLKINLLKFVSDEYKKKLDDRLNHDVNHSLSNINFVSKKVESFINEKEKPSQIFSKIFLFLRDF